jgi:Domain of unknown function (DUF1844)
MAGDESGREPSFKVQDRRRFSATGDARGDIAEEATDAAHASEPAAPAGGAAAPATDETAPGAEPGAEITFASFIFSLSTQALVHLGEVPDPIDSTAHVTLEAARQIIDILAMLLEKTRGNLDPAESALLESALYDLRMRYVDRARQR